MSTHKKVESENGASSMDATEALKLLDQVVAALALPASQSLSAKQRRAATRSRKGMERVVPTLASLSTEHGVSVPKHSTAEMSSNLEMVTQLEAVRRKLTGALTLVGSASDGARSGAWTTATTLYGMLQKVAKRDVQLKSQLAPVEEFFAYRTAAAKSAHPKQKGKKAALAAEKETTAQAAVESSVAATPATPVTAPSVSSVTTPSVSSVAASTTAGALPAAPSVVVPHTP